MPTSAEPASAALPSGLSRGEDGFVRCAWGQSAPGFAAYHDHEWGFPVASEHHLFEKICLEGFQSGLSWRTILDKRPAFRESFFGFDFERVARFGEDDVARLLTDARIVRHRGKIEATINNAQRACEAVERHGSLAALIWRFEPPPSRRPPEVTLEAMQDKAWMADAARLAADLKRQGWRFFGPTTAYAFMQAMGLVNDHLEGCVVRDACEQARAGFTRP
jgi:DNA-3-methyladenine glycosylase I